MSRADDAKALAPIAPPCFETRMQWQEYVAAAAEHQRPGHAPGPLLFEAGKPVRFNAAFSFCTDCTEPHEAQMKRAGRCSPRHLYELPSPSKEPA